MTTFKDIFKKAFLNASLTEISPINILITMMIAFAVALLIYFTYKKCYRGVIYSHNFNVAIAMMTVITAMIISTITSNVVLSLGMVGALSIVRFRTAIKDPVDLMFLFWAVAAGIAIGAKIYWVILIGNLSVAFIFWLLSKFKKRKQVYLLVVRMSNSAFEDVINILSTFEYTVRSKITKKDMTEMTVELHLKDNNTRFVEKISETDNVESVSIVSYDGDFAQ